MNEKELDNKKYEVVQYNPEWVSFFDTEARKLEQIFGDQAIVIEHIGSTAIPGLASKPIIDIAVLIPKKSAARKYIALLSGIGYEYDERASSSERNFFRKYDDVSYHVSIAYQDKGSFWERQIQFRDYLRNHEWARSEYEALKKELINNDPTGRHSYIQGKDEFIERILELAKK